MRLLSKIITLFVVLYCGEHALREMKRRHPELDMRNPLIKLMFPRKEENYAIQV